MCRSARHPQRRPGLLEQFEHGREGRLPVARIHVRVWASQ